MIKNLALTFGSETKAQEMVFLLKDIKEVVRQGFYEEELKKVEKYCEKEKLFVVKSIVFPVHLVYQLTKFLHLL